jgi:methionyl aminopeptidase
MKRTENSDRFHLVSSTRLAAIQLNTTGYVTPTDRARYLFGIVSYRVSIGLFSDPYKQDCLHFVFLNTTMVIICASPGCQKSVNTTLACPNCKKLGLDNYFCGQECFKKNYAAHKKIHAIAKQVIAAKAPKSDGISCALDAPKELKLSLPDWTSNFSFSGSLRPTLLSPKRAMPRNIRRPDYADHFAGASESEQRDKTNHNNIRVYTSNELDGEYGLRHACKMGREVLDAAGKALRVGVTTDEIDRVVHEACIERDCYPSPLNYYK